MKFALTAAVVFFIVQNGYAQGPTAIPRTEMVVKSFSPLGRRLRVNVNCVFRYTLTTITCDDFKSNFFQKHSSEITRVDMASQSDLEVSLTDESVDATHVGYIYKWISHLPETSSEPLIVPLMLSTGFDQLSTLTKLEQNAAKGLYFYFNVTNDISSGDGATVVYKLPTETAKSDSGWLEKLANSPFYFNLSLMGMSSTAGESSYRNISRQFPESLEVGYFTDKYKIDLTGRYMTSFVSTPSGTGGTVSATDDTYNINGLEVYSFSKRWSVAVIETRTVDPGANTRNSNQVQTGIEWTLVPFRQTENRELAFRVGPSFTDINFDAPNVLGHLDENYMAAFAQIYFYWVSFGDRLQASTTANVTDNLKYQGFESYSLSGSLTYNFNSIFSITGTTNFTDSPRSLTFPGNPNYSNSLQALFLSGQPGKSIMYTFGFNVKLGNSVRKARDRRWSTSSN